MIRILVAEDSPTVRALLVAALQTDPSLKVVGEARDGREAIDLTRSLRPDLVTMDIHMPRMDGLEATRRIMIEVPTPILIVSATVGAEESRHSVEALGAGALGVTPTPSAPHAPDHERSCRRLVGMVKALAGLKVVRRFEPRPGPPAPRTAVKERGHQTPVRLVAVGASTGGPAVLAEILRGLPEEFGAPLLIVQHITPGFAEGLASWLDAACQVRVKVAVHGEPVQPGTAYVAGDGAHLGVSEGLIALSQSPPRGGFRPSATHLFESAAAFGNACAAIVLSGMGADGVEGLRAVRDRGGAIVAQNEETSAVFGMPKAAIDAGLVDAVLPPPQIIQTLLKWVQPSQESNR